MSINTAKLQFNLFGISETKLSGKTGFVRCKCNCGDEHSIELPIEYMDESGLIPFVPLPIVPCKQCCSKAKELLKTRKV